MTSKLPDKPSEGLASSSKEVAVRIGIAGHCWACDIQYPCGTEPPDVSERRQRCACLCAPCLKSLASSGLHLRGPAYGAEASWISDFFGNDFPAFRQGKYCCHAVCAILHLHWNGMAMRTHCPGTFQCIGRIDCFCDRVIAAHPGIRERSDSDGMPS
jgi:hypothetical protein